MDEILPKKEKQFETLKSTLKAIKLYLFTSRRIIYATFSKYDLRSHSFTKFPSLQKYQKVQFQIWKIFSKELKAYIATLTEEEEYKFEEEISQLSTNYIKKLVNESSNSPKKVNEIFKKMIISNKDEMLLTPHKGFFNTPTAEDTLNTQTNTLKPFNDSMKIEIEEILKNIEENPDKFCFEIEELKIPKIQKTFLHKITDSLLLKCIT